MTSALDVELDRLFAGGMARGRYGRKDIEAAAPALVLFVASVVPFDELPSSLAPLLRDALEQAGALDAPDEAAFQAAVEGFLQRHPLHKDLQADLRRALERAEQAGRVAPRRKV